METITLNVLGMSCSHCENTIKGAVNELDGVKNVLIDLAGKTVKVTFDSGNVTEESIKSAIEAQGYDVT